MLSRAAVRQLSRGMAVAIWLASVNCAIAQSAAGIERKALDPRTAISLAPAREDNWRCLMRGHLKTLTDAMRQLAAGEYEAAATGVEDNFGLLAGGHEYCREPIFSKEESVLAARLPPSPPAAVRAMFEAMHSAARTFSADARHVATGAEVKVAWTSLAALGATCTACHTVYRLD